jgi:hypothetical protein
MKPTRISTLFYFVFLGMELSYLYILASLLRGPTYALILMLLLYPLALFSKLVVPQSALPHRLRFTLEVALVTLVIVVVTKGPLVSSLATGQVDGLGIILRMGLCGLAWFMGHTVPQERVNYSTIAFRLQLGILVVLVFAQVMGSAPPVFLFFLLAPLALFLARWASSFSRGAEALHSPNPVQLLLAGASVIVPGTALILLFSPGMARTIVNWLGGVSTKLDDWLMAQQKAAAALSGEFKFDFSCSRPPVSDETPPPTSTPEVPPGNATGISPLVIWVIVFVIFLAIVALIIFTLKRRKARRKAQPLEPVQFQIRMVSFNMLHGLISFFPELLKKLWLWLALLFKRWKKRPKTSEEALTSIRALYRSLLRWAARQGVARLPSQTPLEHLVLLEQGFPQQRDDLRQITDAYLLARYSQKTLSQEHFDRVRQAWQRTVAYHTRTQVSD